MTETPVTWTELIIAVIFVLVTTLSPQIYSIFKANKESKDKQREADTKEKERQDQIRIREKEMELSAEETTWKRVISEYDRTIQRATNLEKELEQLRPLAIQNAVLEQKMKQCREDKEDWKAHAERLDSQLQEHNVVPIPFRRNPREETGEAIKTISRKMKAIKEEHENVRTAYSQADGSPTLVFPPIAPEEVKK